MEIACQGKQNEQFFLPFPLISSSDLCLLIHEDFVLTFHTSVCKIKSGKNSNWQGGGQRTEVCYIKHSQANCTAAEAHRSNGIKRASLPPFCWCTFWPAFPSGCWWGIQGIQESILQACSHQRLSMQENAHSFIHSVDLSGNTARIHEHSSYSVNANKAVCDSYLPKMHCFKFAHYYPLLEGGGDPFVH